MQAKQGQHKQQQAQQAPPSPLPPTPPAYLTVQGQPQRVLDSQGLAKRVGQVNWVDFLLSPPTTRVPKKRKTVGGRAGQQSPPPQSPPRGRKLDQGYLYPQAVKGQHPIDKQQYQTFDDVVKAIFRDFFRDALIHIVTKLTPNSHQYMMIDSMLKQQVSTLPFVVTTLPDKAVSSLSNKEASDILQTIIQHYREQYRRLTQDAQGTVAQGGGGKSTGKQAYKQGYNNLIRILKESAFRISNQPHLREDVPFLKKVAQQGLQEAGKSLPQTTETLSGRSTQLNAKIKTRLTALLLTKLINALSQYQ